MADTQWSVSQHRARPLEAPARFGAGLTEQEVQRLRDIIRRDCGVDLTIEQAWARGIELLSFAKMLVESLPPKA
jgi:hypothetical protein